MPTMPSGALRSSAATLVRLGEAAETLFERIDRARGAAISSTIDEETSSEALAPWARAFSAGRLDSLNRRLAWGRIDPEHAAAALLGTAPKPAAPAPWTEWLASYAEAASGPPPQSAPAGRDDGSELLPFADLWQPWLEVVRASLDGSRSERLLPHAWRDLEALLLARLSGAGAMAAYERYDAYRKERASIDGAYRAFVLETLRDPVSRFYSSYPVLARQHAEIARQWRDSVEELTARLAADRDILEQTFAGGEDLGRVRSIRAGLSDPHDDGRQVAVLAFERGVEVVYKPRSVEAEEAWSRLLAWIAEEGLEEAPPSLDVVSRPGYGWIEAVHPAPLARLGAARDYYRRAGALAALAFVVGARDLHSENVVATPAGPVIVDAEMILQPVRTRLASGGPDGAEVSDSCRDTGLLTYPEPGADGRLYERGGLRVLPRRASSRERRAWSDPGGDAMRLRRERAWIEPGENVLQHDGEPVPPEDHVDAVAEGFEAAYRFLLERRDALVSDRGPLGDLEEIPVRLVFRRSQDYANVLGLTRLPRHQRSGLSGSLLREALLRGFADHEHEPEIWPLIAGERRALERGDVPRFEVGAGDTTITLADGTRVTGPLALSGRAAFLQRLDSLGPEDLGRQLEILRRTLDRPAESDPVGTALREGRAAANEADLLELARALGATLHDRGELVDAKLDLASGRVGIALFFAALARADGGPWAERARGLLLPLQERLERDPAGDWRSALGPGICSGTSSILWGLVWLARLLEEESLLDSARRSVDALDLSPRREGSWDLEGGLAGAVLALLALHDVDGDERHLARAVTCGERLADGQETLGSAGAAWRNERGLALAGMAHGAAGIARALAALGERTVDERFRVSAAAALGFERSLFDPERGNWPLFLVAPGQPPRRTWMTAWCHGAPGGALARAWLPSLFADPPLLDELERALVTTRDAPSTGLDHLCCGDLGRSAVLLAAGRRLGRSDWIEEARGLTRRSLEGASRRGGFALGSDLPGDGAAPAGFLKGLAGIGYHLLSFTDPALPHVLAFELPGEAVCRQETDR